MYPNFLQLLLLLSLSVTYLSYINSKGSLKAIVVDLPPKELHTNRLQVYGYRTSLWAEHLGMVDDLFKDPSSLECVNYVNEIAEENWRRFTAEQLITLQGHLLKYPVKVEADGKVGPLPEHECFPDVGGKILGAPTSLPDTLTM